MARSTLILLLLVSPVLGDEIVLKGGKRIEWVSIRDKGDTYEVETPQGTKSIINKDDVETLARKATPEILTGAAFTFDKKLKLQVVDLLAQVDTKRDAVLGTWKRSGAAITGAGAPNVIAKLATTYVPPLEYDVTIVAERKEGADATPDGMIVWLVGADKQFAFQFDALGYTGLNCVDGQGPHNGAPAVPGKFWNGKPRTITIMVRTNAVIMQVDGKDHFTWKAEWNRVSLPPYIAVPNKNTLHIGMGANTYQIHRWTVSAPKQ